MTCPVCVATMAANAAVVSTAISGFVIMKRNNMIDKRVKRIEKKKVDLPVSIVRSQDQE